MHIHGCESQNKKKEFAGLVHDLLQFKHLSSKANTRKASKSE